jgi:hypothetical protein
MAMANHRELASVVYEATRSVTAGKIWRTVVFAGAMLAAPLAACGGGSKNQPTTPTPATDDKAAADKAAADKATADQAAADQATADKAAADKATADKASADQAAADQAAADQKAADDKAAADAKKRPRGGGDRPTGRGFVLA